MGREDIAVVVPTRNSARTIQACLESLRAQNVPCTVIVVDNGSSDSTPEVAQKLADLVLQAGPERSAQRNIGAAATAAEIVGFIDSDMVLATDVVGQAVAAIETGALSVVVPERTLGEGFWAEVRAYEEILLRGERRDRSASLLSQECVRCSWGIRRGDDWR